MPEFDLAICGGTVVTAADTFRADVGIRRGRIAAVTDKVEGARLLEVLSMQVTTISIVYPIATAVGIDPIWLGVFIVLMSELAMITPPVGMNLYVVQSIRRDGGPIGDVIRGVIPYVFIMIAFTILLWFVPQLALWLPRTMVAG